MQVLDGEFATGTTQWMTQCYGTPINIYFSRIKPGFPDNCQCLGGKCFIQFYQINLDKFIPDCFNTLGIAATGPIPMMRG